MTEHPDRNSKLLAETFHDDWSVGRAAKFARVAARHARRRRQLRRICAGASAAAVLVLGGWLFLQRPAPDSQPVATLAKNTPHMPPVTAPASRGYEIISDEQLLAELKDRPLLVVEGTKGTRRIVLLEIE